MNKLLRIELIKILKYRVFQILGIIYVASFIISIVVLPLIKLETTLAEGADMLDIPSFYSFPVIWDTYAWLAAKSNLFLAVIVIFIVGNEYSYRTFRQHIVDGLSRQDLLHGKIMSIAAIALANTAMIFVFGLIFGLIFTHPFDLADVFSRIYILGIYFLQALIYMMLALFITIWLRNKTLSIVVLLVYSLIIEPIIRLVVRKYIWTKLGLFFPVKVITRLTPIPENGLVAFIKANAEINGLTGSLPLLENVIMALIYATIFYFLAKRIISSRDL